MNRRLRAAAVVGIVGVVSFPISVLADPSPSPSLQSILIPAPTGYAAPGGLKSPYQGAFDAAAFASTWGPDSASGQSALNQDGFIAGYGLSRANTSTGGLMLEFVMAFTGQSGALRFLGSDGKENQNDAHYKHPDTATGIGSYYYGVHSASTSPSEFLDGFEFVKGNDILGVAFFSSHDNVLVLATEQAQKLYAAAPAATIPPDQWPENAPVNTGGGAIEQLDATAVIVIVVVILVFAAAFFVWMRRSELRPRASVAPAHEMTADGKYWWSGSNWIPTVEMPPPWAQRSPDGAFWWDGRAWQPVPRSAPPPAR